MQVTWADHPKRKSCSRTSFFIFCFNIDDIEFLSSRIRYSYLAKCLLLWIWREELDSFTKFFHSISPGWFTSCTFGNESTKSVHNCNSQKYFRKKMSPSRLHFSLQLENLIKVISVTIYQLYATELAWNAVVRILSSQN